MPVQPYVHFSDKMTESLMNINRVINDNKSTNVLFLDGHVEYMDMDRFRQVLRETYRRLGNDPYVGRKLVSLIHEAGAAPRRTTFIFFGSAAGAPDFNDTVENLIGVLEGAREAILAEGSVDATRFGQAIAAIREWARPLAVDCGESLAQFFAIKELGARTAYVWALLVPSREFMMKHYAPASHAQLYLQYARRVLSCAWECLKGLVNRLVPARRPSLP